MCFFFITQQPHLTTTPPPTQPPSQQANQPAASVAMAPGGSPRGPPGLSPLILPAQPPVSDPSSPCSLSRQEWDPSLFNTSQVNWGPSAPNPPPHPLFSIPSLLRAKKTPTELWRRHFGTVMERWALVDQRSDLMFFCFVFYFIFLRGK